VADDVKPKFWALWVEAFQSFWRDPKNITGGPGELQRRIFKFAWFVLAFYVLVWVAIPSQIESWKLWMTNDVLATHTGIAMAIASALCFAVVRYAAEAMKPIRVPIFIPKIEIAERRLRVYVTHLHLPNITVLIGSAVAVGLFAMSFLGVWNYYLHENQKVGGGASVVATAGATDHVAEATAALAAHRAAEQARARNAELELSRTPENYATARSRIIAANTEAARLAAETDRQLAAELRVARASNVTVAETHSDPRPVDGVMAGILGWARDVVASFSDAMRSGLFEALITMGAGLSLVGATSQIGVGKPLDTRETPEEPEEPALNDVDPPPAAPQEDERRYRFTLPTATDEDVETANAIGPTQPETAAPEEPAPEAAPEEEPAPEPAQADADPFEDDPLAADHIMNEREDA